MSIDSCQQRILAINTVAQFIVDRQRSPHDDVIYGYKNSCQTAGNSHTLAPGLAAEQWVLNNTCVSKKEVSIELLAASQ
jgi:hypothetical protein